MLALTDTQPLDIIKIPILETPEFIIEDAEVQDLNGKIRKKFTSRSKSPVTYTHIYDPTLFRWDFGDGTPIHETDERVTYHTYDRPGLYLVKHQACNFCACSKWCDKCIKICRTEEGEKREKEKEEECEKEIEIEGYKGCEEEKEEEHSSMSYPLTSIFDDPLFSIKDVDFIVEDASIKPIQSPIQFPIQSLNGGIRKKFTSLATNATLFRWRFGDTHQDPIVETTENPYYHTYRERGTYSVSHQSCIGYSCCSGWCIKSIDIEKYEEERNKGLLALMGFGFIFLMIKKECKDYDTKEKCVKRERCEWLEKDKKCATIKTNIRSKSLK